MEGMRIVRRRSPLVPAAIIGVAVVVVVLLGVQIFSGPDDGIEDGKNYRLAATYKVQIEYAPNRKVPGRVFDFADRNLPRTSIAVPTADDRGIPLISVNPNLPKSMVRKTRVQVPSREIEGVIYPAYEYVLWEYNTASVEIQHIEPPVVPVRR